MKTTVTVLGQPVQISAVLKGASDEFSNGNGTNYVHRVTVSNERGRTSFKFNTSMNDFKNGKDEMDASDLKNALGCFLSDAMAGRDTFSGFCSEFCYDEDSRKAFATYNLCVKADVKASKLFSDIYEAANELNELENA